MSVYVRGRWASASEEDVQKMMKAGHPYCYRFRVPPVLTPSLKWASHSL